MPCNLGGFTNQKPKVTPNRNGTEYDDIPGSSTWQFFVTFLGWLSDLLERLSDLQLGDEKVALNHLVDM